MFGFLKKFRAKGAKEAMDENNEALLAEVERLKTELDEAREALRLAEKRVSAPPPAPSGGGEDGFFTPEEVRRMSRAEVREKMPAIRASMERWK